MVIQLSYFFARHYITATSRGIRKLSMISIIADRNNNAKTWSWQFATGPRMLFQKWVTSLPAIYFGALTDRSHTAQR